MIGKLTATGETPPFRRLVPSPFGDVALVWFMRGDDPRISAVLLPGGAEKATGSPHAPVPGAGKSSSRAVDEMSACISRYFRGDDVTFPLDSLDLSVLSDFQKKVLSELRRVPRGRVVTYGGLAEKVGAPRAARAVGTVMARNPFPLVFPCHRVIRSTGEPGDFGGGPGLKRSLLVREGVGFDERGSIDARYYW